MANPILIGGAAGRVGDLVNDSGVRFRAVLTTAIAQSQAIARKRRI